MIIASRRNDRAGAPRCQSNRLCACGAGCEAGHGPMRVLSFASPSGWRDQMTFCIGRREFITLVGGAAVLWPRAASAQKPGGVRRIGVLLSVAESDPEGKAQLSGFTLGLAELGWIDGRNLRMEVRWGGGDVDQIRTFAKELVALQPDLIVAQGTPVTAALQRETRTIPIVFVAVTDPVGYRFVAT